MDLKKVNFWVTQFATQFTPVSRQYRASNRKLKFKFKKNCFDNVVSYWQNMAQYVHNITLKKKIRFHFFSFLIFLVF